MLRRLRSAPTPLLGIADAALAGLLAVTGTMRRPAAPQARDRTITLNVVDRRIVAHDQNVVALTLAATDRTPLPAWHPGAHLDIRLPSGRLRQYSLCGDPRVGHSYRIAVRRIPDGGGGSLEVHDSIGVGSVVKTSGPRNAFPLSIPGYGSPTQRLRLIAGGIGITPILPMLDLADRLGVDWTMVYTGRSLESLPFIDEVRRFGERVTIRTDDIDGIPSADDLLGECRSGTTVYVCGPAPLLACVRDRLIGRGDVELHFERFAAAPVINGEPFSVTTTAGVHVDVGPEETLLAALQRAGADPPYSCRQGFCGTCRTRVLDGTVEHRDILLTDAERAEGMMLTCVSRAPAGGHLTVEL